RHLRRRRPEERAFQGEGDAALRPDGEVRRLRLQQVARRGVRAARVPDGVHEGASPLRVPRGELVGGDGRHGQGAPVLRGRARDALDAQRSKLLASVGRALEAAEQTERAASQSSLFAEAEVPRGGSHAYVDVPGWDLRQKLLEEKTALGFSISGHLFSVYERELAGFARTPLARLSPGERVWMAGVVTEA